MNIDPDNHPSTKLNLAVLTGETPFKCSQCRKQKLFPSDAWRPHFAGTEHYLKHGRTCCDEDPCIEKQRVANARRRLIRAQLRAVAEAAAIAHDARKKYLGFDDDDDAINTAA